MYEELFEDFATCQDTLRIYQDGKLVFSSQKDRLLPLMEYMETSPENHGQVTVMDKLVGNAAALLAIKAGCSEVFSPLGSELAVETMNKFDIEHHIATLVPRILKDDGTDFCPMEKLSIGKTPEEFYQVMKDLISGKA